MATVVTDYTYPNYTGYTIHIAACQDYLLFYSNYPNADLFVIRSTDSNAHILFATSSSVTYNGVGPTESSASGLVNTSSASWCLYQLSSSNKLTNGATYRISCGISGGSTNDWIAYKDVTLSGMGTWATALSAAANGSDKINVSIGSWDATSYPNITVKVYQNGSTVNTKTDSLNTLKGTTYTVSSLSPSTTYTVSAYFDSLGSGYPYGTTKTVTTAAAGTIPSFTSFSAVQTAAGTAEIQVNWSIDDPSTLTYLYVQYRISGAANYTSLSAGTSATSYTIPSTRVSLGNTYDVRAVMHSSLSNNDIYSSVVTLTLENSSLQPPTPFAWSTAPSGQALSTATLTVAEWNSLVNKINEGLVYSGSSWNSSYASLADTRATQSGDRLTSARFNSMLINLINLTDSGSLPSMKSSGNTVYLSYFPLAVDALNEWIDGL